MLHTFNKFLAFASSFVMLGSSLMVVSPNLQVRAQDARPPTEPACQTVATTPTWNPYPITTNSPNPDVTAGACRDMPMLSFFPIDTAGSNPRELTLSQNQNFDIQLYYVNGARPPAGAITDPNVKIEVVKESETRYRIKGTLTGGNAGSVTSAQEGGDLIVNAPAGTTLDIVANSTRHFPDAMEREYQAQTQGTTPSDPIADNSTAGTSSNPIYTAFPGKTLPSNAGHNFKPAGLEAGFLGYGYILSTIAANTTPTPNLPPALPGQEITIVRGQSGAFQIFTGTDPDNNVPLTYQVNNLPSFCTYDATTRIITCQTNATTPVRTTFTITPTDAKGLAGTPGTFIVNVIEPPASSAPASSAPANLPPTLPGQEITIIRGQSGAFQIFTGTDPDNNVPLTYQVNNLPSFCTYNATTRIITCQTTATTPVRTTFTITPTDAKGLAGTPGTFIVNVIEPASSAPANLPPVLPGQEITIIRGQSGTFTALNPNAGDPDNNYPLTFTPNNVPPFCTYNATTRVTTCQTNASTPVRSTFTITPTDAKGLAGTPGTFIVNVIEPNKASLQINKTANPATGTSVQPNQEITYTLAINNPTQTAADNVIVTDILDTKVTYVENSCTPTCTYTANSRTLTWNLGKINPSQTLQGTFKVKVNTGATGTVTNTGTVTFKDPATNQQTPPVNSNQVNHPIGQNRPPQVPGQEITVVRGDKGVFEAIVGNKGPTDPDGDAVTLTPQNLPSYCSFDQNTKIITCQTDANTPPKLTFTVLPTDSKGLAGTAGTFIMNVVDPDLSVTKACVKKGTDQACSSVKLVPGDEITYKIQVKNNSRVIAKNVRLVDNYDTTNLENVNNVTPANTMSFNQGNGQITWTLGDLQADQSVTATFDARIRATVAENTQIKNVVVAKADGMPDKRAEVQFPVGVDNPNLDTSDKICIDKKSNRKCNEVNLTIGSQVQYQINVRNTGRGPARNVRVVDTFDKVRLSNITNVNPKGTLDSNSGTITWQLGTINAGANKTVSFDATVTTSIQNGDVIINTAKISADNLPEKNVRADFSVGIAAPATPRTGGLSLFFTTLGIATMGGAGFFYWKNNKLSPEFAPRSRVRHLKK